MRKARVAGAVAQGFRDDPLRDPYMPSGSESADEAEAIPLLDDLDSPDPSQREEVKHSF